MNYWLGALGSICRNLAADFGGKRSTRFSFTRGWLSYGLAHDHRRRARSRRFLDSFPAAEDLIVPLGSIQYRRSNMNPYELHCISCIAMLAQPQRIFEIGTFDGATTLQLARVCPQARLFTLDLGSAQPDNKHPERVESEEQNVRLGGVGSRFRNTPESSRITQLLGDSTRFDYTPWLGSIDLVFVDACHEYDFVMADTQNALRLVRPGGTIIWHDYEPGWPGVVRAVDSLDDGLIVDHIADTALAVLRDAPSSAPASRPLPAGAAA